MAKQEFKLRDIQFFDTRTVERHIERGLITRQEYEKSVEELEDCAELARPSNVHFVYTGRAPIQENVLTPEILAAQARRPPRPTRMRPTSQESDED